MVLAVLGVMAVLGIAAHALFLKLLRERAPGHWERLGSPDLIANNNISNSLATQRFILSGQFATVPDLAIRRLGNFIRWFSVAYVLVFGAVLLLSLKS